LFFFGAAFEFSAVSLFIAKNKTKKKERKRERKKERKKRKK
jgi:hypothetical protein